MDENFNQPEPQQLPSDGKLTGIQLNSLNLGGRPEAVASPENISRYADAYLLECEEEKSVPTMAGLAFALGIDRKTLFSYGKKEKFFPVIKRYRDFVLSKLEKRLVNANTPVAGAIFYAKNYGYTDKQEIEFTKPLEIVIRDYRGRELEAPEGRYTIMEDEPERSTSPKVDQQTPADAPE